MVEPIASKPAGQPANDLGKPDSRFDHDSAAPETVDAPTAVQTPVPTPVLEAAAQVPEPARPTSLDPVSEIEVEPEPEAPVAAQPEPEPEPVFLAEPLASPARTPDWPPAWLRVVHTAPAPESAPESDPEPELKAQPALAPSPDEAPRSPGDVAQAFGLTMAAAMDPEAAAVAADPPPVQADLTQPEPVEPPLATRKPRASSAAAHLGPKPASQPSSAPVLDVVDAPLFGSLTRGATSTPRMVTARARTDSPDRAPSAEVLAARADQRGLPGAVYLLYLTSFLVLPAVVGMVLAARARRTAPDWLEGHYLFQIRTFWIALAGVAIAVALAAISSLQETELIGLFLPMLLVVWMVLRSARGYLSLLKLRGLAEPRTWLI